MVEETIRVILTGICTFVGAGVGNNGRPLTAVFPNATHHRPEHHVSLIIPAEDYDVKTNNVAATPKDSEMGTPFHIVRLDGKSIAVRNLLGDELEQNDPPLSGDAKRLHRPTTLTEMESVKWIPSLGRSWPRMFPMRPARRMHLGFYSQTVDPQLVSSYMEMPKGKLASHWVGGDVWRFTPRSMTRHSYKTALAQEVRYEVKISGTVLHFDLCDFQQQHCGFVRITRKDPTKTDPIEVMIANVTDDDQLPGSIVFCGECGRSECEDPADPFPCTCVDHHYTNYYHAMKNRMPERPSLPRRTKERWPPMMPVTLRVGGGNCPPSDYP